MKSKSRPPSFLVLLALFNFLVYNTKRVDHINSSSGQPYRTPKGHSPSWTSKVLRSPDYATRALC